ncbi:GNAT family N-acetyltransferase [Variovorax flavidus]|uniref:GNAT family N-acetyltransferase n=1 Tax=Variovorax flavidus TaxID=3053501 RepID=UPI0033657519
MLWDSGNWRNRRVGIATGIEGLGIGKALLGLVVDEFRATDIPRLFLGCSTDPRARSHGFYRHLGWVPTGVIDALNDEVLEYHFR